MGLNEDNVIVGEPYERGIYSSLGEVFMLLLKMHNEKPIQIDAATGEVLTAKILLTKAIALAKWLKSIGLGPGDNISISSENCLDFCVVPIAAFLTGITLAPLNPEYTPGELKHVVNLSKPKGIFCSSNTIQQILSIRSEFPYLKTFVLLGKNPTPKSGVLLFKDITNIGNINPDTFIDEFQPTAVDPDDTVAVILCSSGTTGLPKGVMTTHYNITAYFEIVRHILQDYLATNMETLVITGVTPFFHGMGFMSMLLAMVGGNTLIMYSKFDPKLFLESISKYRITSIVVPPTILSFLDKHPMVKNYDLSSIKDIKSGSAPMGKDLERKIIEKFDVKQVSQNYGMTETTLGVLMTYPNRYKPGSAGRIVPGMKCKIVDENGKSVGVNQKGELCFQGPLIMKGYINDPESTAKVIDKENWLHTGDVGYYDRDGFFYVVDRIKELIKYKGFQVAPAELEGILLMHPAVADVAVVGIEDERAGELPLAFVVKKTNKVTAEELEKYIADRVSSAKRLRGGVYFIKAIPRNPSGKILRRVLRDNAKTMMSKL